VEGADGQLCWPASALEATITGSMTTVSPHTVPLPCRRPGLANLTCGSGACTARAGVSGFSPDRFRLCFCESVTDVAVGQQICRFIRVVFELLARLANESPQIFQLAPVLRTPHCMQKPRVRNWQASMRHEMVQEIKFRRRQMNRLAAFANQETCAACVPPLFSLAEVP